MVLDVDLTTVSKHTDVDRDTVIDRHRLTGKKKEREGQGSDLSNAGRLEIVALRPGDLHVLNLAKLLTLFADVLYNVCTHHVSMCKSAYVPWLTLVFLIILELLSFNHVHEDQHTCLLDLNRSGAASCCLTHSCQHCRHMASAEQHTAEAARCATRFASPNSTSLRASIMASVDEASSNSTKMKPCHQNKV